MNLMMLQGALSLFKSYLEMKCMNHSFTFNRFKVSPHILWTEALQGEWFVLKLCVFKLDHFHAKCLILNFLLNWRVENAFETVCHRALKLSSEMVKVMGCKTAPLAHWLQNTECRQKIVCEIK